jgi:hypothetical protein
LFAFYERNGGFVDLDGDFQSLLYTGHRYAAGIIAQNDQELQEIGEVLQQLKIDCVSVTYPGGKLVQRISGKESVRLFKRVLDEIADAYVFNVPETFAVLDFTAELDFKNESSASFRLITIEDIPATEKHIAVENASVWFGWLDVHYITNGRVKVELRVGVHEKYEGYKTKVNLEEIVRSVFQAFGIPADETYELRFIVEKQILMDFRYENRWGMSSVIVD